MATTGNDANDGTTVGTPFLTIQKALNTVAIVTSTPAAVITVQVADGTYNHTDGITLPNHAGYGTYVLQGNTAAPQNVVIACSATSTNGVLLGRGTNANWTIQGFELRYSGSTNPTYMVYANMGATLYVANLRFAAASAAGVYHMYASENGYLWATGSYTIVGGGSAIVTHVYAATAGIFRFGYGITVTITNSLPTSSFVYAAEGGIIAAGSAAFAGAGATGARYTTYTNGIIQTYGSGATYFPGNSSGNVGTGGIYN